MLRAAALVMTSMLAVPLASRADESCPWINAATVAGIMGGAAQSKVVFKPGANRDGVCEFTETEDRSPYTVRVEVATAADAAAQVSKLAAKCGSKPAALHGIGNEAVTCSTRKDEVAIGRVRDRTFVIRLHTNAHGSSRKDLAEKAASVAEQVAGNLY